MHIRDSGRGRVCAAAVVAAAMLSVTISEAARQGATARATPPAPAGFIAGNVVDGDSGSPLGGVLVRIASAALPAQARGQSRNLAVLTGTDGRFLFRELPKGSFSISAQRADCLPGAYGQHAPLSVGGQSIDLDDGQRVGDATIRLWQYASITGTVTDEAGEPVIGVTVRAFLRTILAGHSRIENRAVVLGGAAAPAITDDRGVYNLVKLPPGDYVIGVPSSATTIPLSVRDAYARSRPATPDGQSLRTELEASSAPLPSQSGLVSGNFLVSAGAKSFIGGSTPFTGPGQLPLAPNGRAPVFATVFHPGVPAVTQATTVTVGSGDERAGIDVRLQPVSTVELSGTIVGPQGPQPYFGVRLTQAWAEEFAGEMVLFNFDTVSDEQGRFTFLGVPPGQYVLRAQRRPLPPPPAPAAAREPGADPPPPPIPAQPTLWAAVPVALGDQGVDGMVVTLRTGARITGHLEFDGTIERPPAARLARLTVAIELANGRLGGNFGLLGFPTPQLGQVDAGGQITTYGLPSGKYIVSMANPPAGWFVKSALLNGRDVSVTPLELRDADMDGLVLTLTDRPVKLSGTVRTAEGRGDPAADVIVFTADRAGWMDAGAAPRRVRTARASRDGTYAFTGLPPGEYFIAALPDEAMTNWSDPKFLEALAAKATRLHIGETGPVRQDLQTGRAK